MPVGVALCFVLQLPAHAQGTDQAGTVGLSTTTPQVGVAVTATLTDPDGGVTGTTWEWSSSDTSDGTYAGISGATSASYTPVAADHGKFLKATASYTDMHGSGKSAEQVADNAVVLVSLLDPSGAPAESPSAGPQRQNPPSAQNGSPAFPSPADGVALIRSIDENTNGGVGAPVAATDPDNDSLTYAISGDDAEFFTVDSSTGQLSTGAALDYETRDSYTLTVSVHDNKDTSGGQSAEIDDAVEVRVEVTNVDEAGSLRFLPPAEPRVGTVATTVLTDPDGGLYAQPQSMTWTWERSADKVTWVQIEDFGLEHYPNRSLSPRSAGASHIPTTDDEGTYLRVTVANYQDGQGTGKTAQAVTEHVVGNRMPEPPLTVVPLVSGLTFPIDLAFTHDQAMLFVERPGKLSVRVSDGTVRTVTTNPTSPGFEAIALDPQFASNRRFYAFEGVRDPNDVDRFVGYQLRVWTIDDTYQTATQVGQPIARGPSALGTLLFDPNGYLWLSRGGGGTSLGDPQDLTSLGGKMLRLDPTTAQGAPGNPFSSAPLVYSYGHRHPQGIALRPGTSEIWIVEHGPRWDDEINVMTAGGNYGWDPPTVRWSRDSYTSMTDTDKFPDAVEAQWTSGFTTLAASGGVFLEGADWGPWNGRLAVATLKAVSLRIFEFNDSAEFVSQVAPLPLLESYGRLRTVRMGPDGALYVTTSNSPSNDNGGVDKILRVVPSLPPEFSSPHETHEVPENSSPGTVITTVSAIDPEVRALRYELGGVHAEFFSLANNKPGELQTKAKLDYEQQNSYDLVVTAFDDYGLTATLVVTVTVTDVEEGGVVTLTPPRGWVDTQTQFSAALTDGDGGITATVWRWRGRPTAGAVGRTSRAKRRAAIRRTPTTSTSICVRQRPTKTAGAATRRLRPCFPRLSATSGQRRTPPPRLRRLDR